MDEKNLMRYETKIQLVPSSYQQINKQFALVDILLCYHGRNRNMTSMSKEVIEKALPSLYGIPIVGEYYTLDDGSKDFGTHGGKIIITDDGIKYEQTTKPYGFITKEAVENASWVTITEKDGHTKHEYLKLSRNVIWKDRYEEVEKILDENYGESMEIAIDSYEYDKDGYCVIKDFTFSAACILGSHLDGSTVVPCFESSKIGRLFEVDSFKQEFSQMLDEYNKLTETDSTATVPNKHETNSTNMKGAIKMELAKFTEILSAIKIGESDVCKYRLLNVTDSKVFALDMEDYKPYGFDYAVTTEEDAENIVVDFESKAEMSLSATEKITDENFEEFDIKSAIDAEAEKYAETKTAEHTAILEGEFNKKVDELKTSYDDLSASYAVAMKKLDEYEAKEAQAKAEQHEADVKAMFEKYAEKLGKCSEFLVYKAKCNPAEVTVDELNEKLTLMVGKYMMDSQTKKNFSYNPTETKVTKVDANSALTARYGNLLDKYIK